MELVRRVCALGGSDGFSCYTLAEASANPIPLIHFPFNPEIVKIVADEAAQDAGVHMLLHAQVMRPLLSGQRVEGIVIETPSGRTALRAKIVVDATGDAAVAAASGMPCDGEGAAPRRDRQPCTLTFRMSNVDVQRFRALPRDLKRSIALDGIREGRLFWESLSFCSTPGGTDAICLMSRISDIDALDCDDLTRAAVTGRQQVKSIVRTVAGRTGRQYIRKCLILRVFSQIGEQARTRKNRAVKANGAQGRNRIVCDAIELEAFLWLFSSVPINVPSA